MRNLAFFLAFLVLAPLTDAIAQEQPLQPGQLVRVTAPDLDMNRHEETFQQVRGDTLVFTSMRCPLSDVTRLEVYGGRKSHRWRGAGIGFLAGYAVGFGLWHVTGAGCYEYSSTSTCAATWGGGVGAVSGALLGALVGGSVWKTDGWEEVPLDRLRVGIVPEREGFGIRASMVF
jgi:hypothetical protein